MSQQTHEARHQNDNKGADETPSYLSSSSGPNLVEADPQSDCSAFELKPIRLDPHHRSRSLVLAPTNWPIGGGRLNEPRSRKSIIVPVDRMSDQALHHHHPATWRQHRPAMAMATIPPADYPLEDQSQPAEGSRRRPSANLFQQTVSVNMGAPDDHHHHYLLPVKPRSVEWRRSVCEPGRLVRARSGLNLSVLSQQEEDELSLDEILASIQAGRLPIGDAEAAPQLRRSWPPEADETEFASAVQGVGQQVVAGQEQQAANGRSSLARSLSASCSLSNADDSNQSEPPEAPRGPAQGDEAAERRRSEILHGFEIAWLDFTYSVEPNVFEDPRWGRINRLFHKERRMILKGLSGGLKSGQMVALMGPSGAGKTCLLESISGLRTAGIGGRMCLRGRKRAQLVIVPQYDDFLPQFSVEETVVYGSRMKNPPGTDHRKVASAVIEQLGLEACRSNNIRRCSGGQRKRVAIAQELVSKPNILILDEPTSGLDSSCCYHTMSVLRDVLDKSVLTDQPMAIVSTIHQPSAKVFRMFDLVYLLGKTGHMAYSGPPDELVSTVREVTGLECPKYSNPSDFMIELVAYDYGHEPVERMVEYERQKAELFRRDFEQRAGLAGRKGSPAPSPRLAPSKSDSQLMADRKEGQLQRPGLRVRELLAAPSGVHVDYRTKVTLELRRATSNRNVRHPFLWHAWVHLHRSFLQQIRDPILNNMRILIHLGFAALLVLLYGKKSGEARGCPPILGLPLEITDPQRESMIDLADNVGYIFMCIMMITYVSLMSTVLTFPVDIKTVGKEYKNGWYGTPTYFLGKTLADLPFVVLYPVVYCLITWFLTNQASDHAWRFFSFTGLIIMNAMSSQSFGLILGALFVNSVTSATFLGPVITIPWYIFTGYTKRVHRLSEPFKSTSRFLFTRYVFEGIIDTVYGHERCNCSDFLERYYELRFEEANRLGQLISAETLSSLDYYDGLDSLQATLTTFRNSSSGSLQPDNNWLERTVDAASTVFADGDLNLASLMDSNSKASSLFTFGLDFEPTCPNKYETHVYQDFHIEENMVQRSFVTVLTMLATLRVITFVLVSWKIRTREL